MASVPTEVGPLGPVPGPGPERLGPGPVPAAVASAQLASTGGQNNGLFRLGKGGVGKLER